MRAYTSIFDTTALTFLRYTGEGFEGDDGLWVNSPRTSIKAEGDLQPIDPYAQKQMSAPQGFITRGSYYFSSRVELNTVDDVGNIRADVTTIAGRRYFVMSKADWNGSPLCTDYIDYELMLESIPNNGGGLVDSQ